MNLTTQRPIADPTYGSAYPAFVENGLTSVMGVDLTLPPDGTQFTDGNFN